MSVLRPMTPDEYATWLAEAIPEYAADKVAAGQWAAEGALELSRKEYEELLPQGPDTPDNHLFMVLDTDCEAAGMLWFAVQTKFNARIAYVYDISIHEDRRRQGHGRRAFLALEDEVRRLELTGVALHVFGHATGARAMYAGLGYEPTNISLFKPIGPQAA